MKSNPFVTIYHALNTVLTKKYYKLWFVLFTLIFIFAYVFIPVWLTPGNSLSFQLSIFKIKDYILFVLLSMVTALLLLMQIFLFKVKKQYTQTVSQGGVGVFSALFAGLLATAACSSCIAAVLGFLGAGSVFFVLENQPYVVFIAIILVVISLYFSSKRVLGYCKDCDNFTKKTDDEN